MLRFKFEDGYRYMMPAHLGGMRDVTATTTYRDVTNLIIQYGRCSGATKWKALAWEQAPTQAHITAALAGMPVLEVTAFVTRGESILLGDKAIEVR